MIDHRLAKKICGNCKHKCRCPECIPNSDQGHCELDPNFKKSLESPAIICEIKHDNFECSWNPPRFEPYDKSRELGSGTQAKKLEREIEENERQIELHQEENYETYLKREEENQEEEKC